MVEFCSIHNYALFIGCDSNAHNTSWGSTNTNNRGIKLLEFLVANNLTVLNHGVEPTFLTTRRQEVLDISIASPDAKRFKSNWHVSLIETLSDHRRIHFELCNPVTIAREFRNPRKIDYLSFNIELSKSLPGLESLIDNTHPTVDQIDGLADKLQLALNNAMVHSCPVSKPKSNKKSKSWWSKELGKLKTEC